MDETQTVLIVEDDEPIRNILVGCLERAGFSVEVASGGKQGIELALERHPDVILLDLLMPEVDGIDVLKALRGDQWGAEVPVVLLTNDSDVRSINEALQLGIKSYFVKVETDPSEVPGLIREALSNN